MDRELAVLDASEIRSLIFDDAFNALKILHA